MTKPATASADSIGSVSSSRFGNYSAAVLALTTSAVGSQAAIVYSNPTDVTLNTGQLTYVNFMDGSFGGSGLFVENSFVTPDYVTFYAGNAGVNALAYDGRFGVDPQDPAVLSRFTLGQSIGNTGGTSGWTGGNSYAAYRNEPGFPWDPNSGSVTGYVGVRLDDIGQGVVNYYYGWLRMTYNKDAQTLTLHDFAYQSTQNVAINAGAVPEPAETGLLAALGAGGLATWRKLRQKRRSNVA